MDEIKLANKNKRDYKLISIGNNTYQLQGDFEHLRLGVILGYPKSYSYITPEGGPCIALNDTFRGVKGKVVSIEEVKGEYIVVFK